MLYVRFYPKTILYFKDNFWVFQPKIHTGILKTFLSAWRGDFYLYSCSKD